MSTSVIEQSEGLLDKVHREHAAQRCKSFAQYRDLLLRNGTPAKGDGEKLHALLAELDLKPTDARRHLAVLQEGRRHEATVAEADEAKAAYDEVHEKLSKHKVETKKITARRRGQQAELENTRMTALCRCKDIHLAGKLLEKLRAEHCELFGVETD